MPTPTSRPTISTGAQSWMVSQMASRPTSRTSAPFMETSWKAWRIRAPRERRQHRSGMVNERLRTRQNLPLEGMCGLGRTGLSLVAIDAVVGRLHDADRDLSDQRLERVKEPPVAGPFRRDQHDGV